MPNCGPQKHASLIRYSGICAI